MSLERAKAYWAEYGLAEQIMEFEVSSATVAEAAEAIHCEAREIAKSLSFLVDGAPILIVAAGDAKVDNGKYKATFGTKAKMLPFEDVEPLIGHAVGGVCPFGINEAVRVYLDCSLKRLPAVYPACGSSNSAIKLTPEQLQTIVRYEAWVDVCKEPVATEENL